MYWCVWLTLIVIVPSVKTLTDFNQHFVVTNKQQFKHFIAQFYNKRASRHIRKTMCWTVLNKLRVQTQSLSNAGFWFKLTFVLSLPGFTSASAECVGLCSISESLLELIS